MEKALNERETKSKEKRFYKTLLMFILGFALVLLSVNYLLAKPSVEPTTDFILKDLTGRERALKDFRGKIVVLIYGDLNQQNTLKATQDLKKIIAEKRTYRESVEVLLIVTGGMKSKKYVDMKRKLEIPYPILLDDQRIVYALYEIIAIPTTTVIDRSGKIAAVFPSHTLFYYDQIDSELGYLLGEVKEEELKGVLHPKPSPIPINEKTERILSLAENLRRRCFYDRSLHSYKKVLEENPTITKAHLGMGIVYLEKKNIDEAEEQFQKVLNIYLNDPVALKGMAQVSLLRGDINRAENLLRKVLSSNYVDDDIFYLMGELNEKKGNLEEALQYYKKNCQKFLQKKCLR